MLLDLVIDVLMRTGLPSRKERGKKKEKHLDTIVHSFLSSVTP